MTYYAMMTVATAFALLSSRDKRVTATVLFLFLGLFAGTRVAVDNDFDMYWSLFADPAETYAKYGARGLEPSIYALPALAHFVLPTTESAVRATFLIFAFLGVGAKVLGIVRSSTSVWLSVGLYVTYLFLMQEMTTIRAGVASGLFLVSLPHLVKREHWRFLGYMAAALMFHTSSLLFVIGWGLIALRVRVRYFFVALASSLVIALTDLNLLTLLRLDAVFPKIREYVEMQAWAKSADLNLFNFRVLFSLLMLAAFTWLFQRLRHVPGFVELYKIHILSLVVFFALSPTISVFSIRAFEMLSVVQVILYPMVLIPLSRNHRIVAVAGLVAFCALQAYFLVGVSGIFKPYQSWLF